MMRKRSNKIMRFAFEQEQVFYVGLGSLQLVRYEVVIEHSANKK